MDGEEFYAVACELLKAGNEASWRSAISRGYYAAWHVARLLIKGQGVVIAANYQAHAAVRDWLLNSKKPEISHLGSCLGDLHSMRLKADYRLDDVLIRKETAQLELLKVKAFIRELRQQL